MNAPGSPGPSHTSARIATGIVILFLATLVALDLLGRSRRAFAPGRSVLEVARPEQAHATWKERGLRGRTLILFGPFPHLWRTSYVEGARRATEQSFVERAALDNIVRRVYFVVEDDRWEALFGRELPGFFRKVPGMKRGLYMHYPLGLPVIATTPSSLPRLHEPALVYVDRGRFAPAYVQEVLSRKWMDFDLLVVSTGI